MNLGQLYLAADKHMLTAVLAYALEAADVANEEFTQAKARAIRKIVLMDAEKKAVLSRLEDAGIWYLPLKGAVLKDLYPAIGMRQMSDFDILIDSSRRSEINQIMIASGFRKAHSSFVDDAYYKEPVSNFELHSHLFSKTHKNLFSYFENINKKMLPDRDNCYGRHLGYEDFYIYMIAHEYKHYAGGGTGIRSLLDQYVILKKTGDQIDWKYISAELEKIGLASFERKNRSLSEHLFSGKPLTGEEQEMLEYIAGSGTYGNIKNSVENGVRDRGDGTAGSVRYFLSRAFLTMDQVQDSFPFFYRWKILLPLLPFFRLVRGITFRRKKMRGELKALWQIKKR